MRQEFASKIQRLKSQVDARLHLAATQYSIGSRCNSPIRISSTRGRLHDSKKRGGGSRQGSLHRTVVSEFEYNPAFKHSHTSQRMSTRNRMILSTLVAGTAVFAAPVDVAPEGIMVGEPVGIKSSSFHFTEAEMEKRSSPSGNYYMPPYNPASYRPPSDTSSFLPEAQYRDAMLRVHNNCRAAHGVPALKWSQDMVNYAQTNTPTCAFAHTQTLGRDGIGENILYGPGSPEGMVQDMWYEKELKLYNFARQGFAMSTGHMTQMVWKATTEVGCAVKKCPQGTYVKCNYRRPGNVMGQFEGNVPAPKSAVKSVPPSNYNTPAPKNNNTPPAPKNNNTPPAPKNNYTPPAPKNNYSPPAPKNNYNPAPKSSPAPKNNPAPNNNGYYYKASNGYYYYRPQSNGNNRGGSVPQSNNGNNQNRRPTTYTYTYTYRRPSNQNNQNRKPSAANSGNGYSRPQSKPTTNYY
ncbi:hypothetical protein TWF730_003935 [Orbilia blumenaviensis]|uniref:SCP domain-containing protein n=1 Tax=Orbilia blumenaviensis TaxID=1796055 RepID=A0AAV9U571_9PEZI